MFHTPRSRYVFAAICLTSVASVLACSNTPDESDDSPLTSTGGAASGGVDGTGAAPAMGTGAMPDSGTGGGMIGGTGGDTAPPRPEGFAELEKLDRGVVVTPATGGGNLISWRLWGFEDQTQGFHVYRDGEKLTNDPVTASTNFHDAGGSQGASYTVTALTSGVEQPPSKAANLWNGGYLEIPTPPPAPGSNVDGDYSYNSGDGSVGDLDGDGQYEVIIKWDPTNAKDNSQSGHTGNVFIDAYQFNGTRMWRLDLGVNIRAGAHYTQFMVYDLDGDGKAEVAMKTAPGTRDSSGEFLRTGPAATDDHGIDYRNDNGYILSGPEYLTIFNGLSGEEIVTVPFDVARGNVGDWGDTYGNRVDRFLATIAFVDDTGRPSLIMGRGMYTRTTMTAWNFRDGQLSQIWKSDNPANGPFGGKGAHGISVANVDDDPQQEIIGGSATFDHDGKGICAVTFYGHGDALHVSDLIPSRPGLEVFMPFESSGVPAYAMRDAHTCAILWKGPDSSGEGPGRGVAGDVDPNSPGAEAWVSGGQLLRGENGNSYANKPSYDNFLIWWDGDLSRELLNGNSIRQYDGEGGTLTADGCSSNNGSKSTPTLSADIIGDWREEVIFRCGESIRIYSTGEPTEHRIYTLMHDPQYRVAISWQNVEYNQPPHPSFHIGEGMNPPPIPDITHP